MQRRLFVQRQGQIPVLQFRKDGIHCCETDECDEGRRQCTPPRWGPSRLDRRRRILQPIPTLHDVLEVVPTDCRTSKTDVLEYWVSASRDSGGVVRRGRQRASSPQDIRSHPGGLTGLDEYHLRQQQKHSKVRKCVREDYTKRSTECA